MVKVDVKYASSAIAKNVKKHDFAKIIVPLACRQKLTYFIYYN